MYLLTKCADNSEIGRFAITKQKLHGNLPNFDTYIFPLILGGLKLAYFKTSKDFDFVEKLNTNIEKKSAYPRSHIYLGGIN